MPALTEAQARALEIVPRITAALSVLGSTFIFISILVRRRQRQGVGQQRLALGNDTGASLLMAMSLADLLSSSSYVIGSVAFPQANGGQGSQVTCQGA